MESNDTKNPEENAITQTKVIREQTAEIISGGHVFYNPVQEFNRDLSVSVLNVYFQLLAAERREKGVTVDPTAATAAPPPIGNYKPGEKYADGLRILEALSATGLRSIRYAKEVSGIQEIIANDYSKRAVECIKDNVRHNNVGRLVEPSHSDALTLMYMSAAQQLRFDVIDLDPYGCPNRFLDGAIQAVTDGGLLLVTATDMAVLAGNAPESCFAKYGSVPLRMKSCHEMALRIVLHCIESHANRYGKYIEPLLSVSADFYVRLFVRVHSGQAKCKLSMSKQSMIFQCTGCDTFTLQPLGILKPNPTEKNPHQMKFAVPTGPAVGTTCEHCGFKFHMGGPIWTQPIHDRGFVRALLAHIKKVPANGLGTNKRLIGMLTVILEELPDVPLYYTLDKLCCLVKLEIVPILQFRSVLLYSGHRVSYSHALKNSIKTDAPAEVIWDILRCWNRLHPVKEARLQENPVIKAILSKSSKVQYDFGKVHPDANPRSRRLALSRFQENPTAFWGPGTRSTMMVGPEKVAKSFRNQNKNKNKGRGRKQTEEEEVPQDVVMTDSTEDAEGNEEGGPTFKRSKVDTGN